MLKLYKRIGAHIYYREAWTSGDQIIEHWGEVGSQGHKQHHPLPHATTDENGIENVLREARQNGFAELTENDLSYLVIEFEIEDNEDAANLEKRHELEERMNELLGWTGLGHCDGGSIGSGSMEVACMVVDVDIAKRVIAQDLRDTKFENYARMFVQ